jgi:hypothetical protein
MKTTLVVSIALVPGRCRWCGCTEEFGCSSGCSWANPSATLCSSCVDIDRQMRSMRGRAAIVVDALMNRGEL